MYERPCIRGVIYTNVMHHKYRSLEGNRWVQVFATTDDFAAVYPMEFKSLSGQALKEFMSDFSVPDQIPMDGTSE